MTTRRKSGSETGKKQGTGSSGKRKDLPTGWKTSDEDEIRRRVERAKAQPMDILAVDSGDPIFSRFIVTVKGTNRPHEVEIRSLTEPDNTCDCPDFRVNGLGTCKHILAVMNHLESEVPQKVSKARESGSPLTEVFLCRTGAEPQVSVRWGRGMIFETRRALGPLFSSDGTLLADPLDGVPAVERAVRYLSRKSARKVRISREVEVWHRELVRRAQREKARQAFLEDVSQGRRVLDPPGITLYPYQREGALHLAFGERSLLADDMGLGKTVQAIVAADILRQTRHIERVLVVAPVSLKTEWEEQIRKFSRLSSQIILGPRPVRMQQYRSPAFFNLVNYEQVVVDCADIVRTMAPDLVILDEAQRIKNWQTKTAQIVKQLYSPYAFVLTGTPLENRIDEVYSIVQFLDQELLGPLFRFNRRFYMLDEKGKPVGYKNLDELNRTLRAVMLRRRKRDVEDELPPRTSVNRLVQMSAAQKASYDDYESMAARLIAQARKRPLRKEEFDRLQRWLACMRMLCDTTYILDQERKDCPKLPELEAVIDSALANEDSKIIIFSEWERMLQLVRGLLRDKGLSFAWHTGSVPQKDRRGEIRKFKDDPDCRIFLSTDSGATGLNLQVADTVVNLDLPWNPAKLEQRIARAWRKHQKRPVLVVNLITENSIEERMLGTLALKQKVAEGVLDGMGHVSTIDLPSGRAAMVERMEAVLGVKAPQTAPSVAEKTAPPPLPVDPVEAFRQDLAARLADRLITLDHRTDPDGKLRFMMVVDGSSDDVRSWTSGLLQRLLPAGAPEPELEVLDRGTFELIQRLTSGGFLQGSAAAPSPSVGVAPQPPSKEELRKRRRQEASRLLSGIERQRKLSLVMGSGGFPMEALEPLSKALESLLVAACHIVADLPLSEKTVPEPKLVELLRPEGLYPPATQQVHGEIAAWMASDSDDLDEAEAEEALSAAGPVLDGLVEFVKG